MHELEAEQNTRDFAFATLVALEDIEKGDPVTSTNVAPMRPSVGDFYARDHKSILGKRTTKYISKGEHIVKLHLSN